MSPRAAHFTISLHDHHNFVTHPGYSPPILTLSCGANIPAGRG